MQTHHSSAKMRGPLEYCPHWNLASWDLQWSNTWSSANHCGGPSSQCLGCSSNFVLKRISSEASTCSRSLSPPSPIWKDRSLSELAVNAPALSVPVSQNCLHLPRTLARERLQRLGKLVRLLFAHCCCYVWPADFLARYMDCLPGYACTQGQRSSLRSLLRHPDTDSCAAQ